MIIRIIHIICIASTFLLVVSCSANVTSELPRNANRIAEMPYSTNRALTEKQRDDRRNNLNEAIDHIYRTVRIKDFKPLQNQKLSVGNDFEIRIAVGPDLWTPRILALGNRNELLSASYLPAISIGSKAARPAFIDVTPKSGWENLINRLQTSRITDLRDEFTLVETEPVEDMGWIVVEIKNKNGLRLYAYRDDCNTPIPDGKKLVSFIDFLEKDFGINLINCNGTD